MPACAPAPKPYALLNARTIRDHVVRPGAWGRLVRAAPTGNRYGDDAGHACIAVAGPVERTATIETRAAPVKPICGYSPGPHWSCSKRASRRIGPERAGVRLRWRLTYAPEKIVVCAVVLRRLSATALYVSVPNLPEYQRQTGGEPGHAEA